MRNAGSRPPHSVQNRTKHRGAAIDALEPRCLLTVVRPDSSTLPVHTTGASTALYHQGVTQGVTRAVVASTQLAFTTQPTSGNLGVALTPALTVTIEDSNNTVVTNDTSSVTLSIASGPTGATLGGTLTVAAVNGVATFSNIIPSAVGTYTLVATDGALAPATSNPITISVSASKLVFATPPTAGVKNVAINPPITVFVEDANGNVVTGNTTTVNLAIATGPTGATLGGTLSVQAVNGIATFSNVIPNQVGTYTLTATAGPLTPATTPVFIVTTPQPATLKFINQPLGGVKFNALTPINVEVLDTTGALVTTDTSTVTIAIVAGPPGATLNGTLSVAAVKGIATFNNIIPTAAGTYQLVARDGSLAPATSFSFTIFNTPKGVPAQLAFTSVPLTATIGAAIPGGITVSIEDALGNVVTTDHSTVTLTSPNVVGTLTAVAVEGVATFTTVIPVVAGTYQLTAIDGSLTPSTSTSITVSGSTANGATHLAFFQAPTTGTARTLFSTSTIVYIEDSSNSIVTTDNSTVTLGIANAPPGAALNGTTTVNAVNGVATFTDITPTKPGTYLLQAQSALLSGTEAGETVVVPPVGDVRASRLVFPKRPSNGKAGKKLHSIQVYIENRLGKRVTTDKSSVRIAIRSGPEGATLVGTVRAVVSNGIATFSNLTLDKKGIYHFVVRDASLVPAVSKPFTVK